MSRLLLAVRRRLAGVRRSGSALLFSVGLLQLLALMGAAWMVTARADRHGSAFNVANTQVDLLVEGLRNMTIGVTTDAPLSQVSVDPSSNRWQASRVPDVTGPQPVWPHITGPLMTGVEFASPLPSNGSIVTTALRTRARPSSATILGRVVPTLVFEDGKELIAVDTDRDGVADAALWPLPVGQINGITYYAAARIIDHNSALNASLAWRRGTALDAPGNVFPVNVDLEPMLVGGSAEMNALTLYRGGNAPINLMPIDDTGSPRWDFVFTTPYDALWQQLGRRLGNPGYNTPGNHYRALSSADAATLVYGFVRRNPNNSPTLLEAALAQSLVSGVPTSPYAPSQISQWAANFDYTGANWSRRALLAVNNPVSSQLQLDQPPPQFLNPPASFAAMKALDAMPVRTSINTANFGELWRTYWAVMATQVDSGTGAYKTPFGDAGATAYNIYDPAHPQRMFRSSLRDPRYADVASLDSKVARFAPQQQLALRSALAALNTLDLRDADREPTMKKLALTARIDDADVPVEVLAFGGEAQPFITEVYAQTDFESIPAGAAEPNLNGYVAIELFNPYPWDLTIDSAYCLATLDRRSPTTQPAPTNPYPNMKLTSLAALPGPVTIPAGGRLLMENYRSDNTGTAKYRPGSSGLPLQGDLPADATRVSLYVPDLDAALDRELILLKKVPGTSPTLEDMAPIDQFDFTGMPAAGEKPYHVLHYVRCNDNDANRWKPIYPGRYDGTKAKQRFEGTQQEQFDDTTAEPLLAVAPNLGAADAIGSYVNPFVPIQWCTVDSAGPHPVVAPTGNRFPFGGFARLGDILQVPFIGRYTVRPRGVSDTIIEMNSVTMDTAFADDGDPSSDAIENVGRFCPTFASGGGIGYTTPPSGSGYDPSQANPIVRDKFYRRFTPSTPPSDWIIRNETRGEMHATWTNDLKGFQHVIWDGFHGTVDFVNCLARDITRDAGVHTDGFWVAGNITNTDVEVRWTDCVVRNIAGPSILWENGSAKRLLFRNTSVDWKYEIKLMPGCVIDEIVFDNTYGNLSFTFKGGRVNKIYLNNFHGGRMNCPGAQVIFGMPPDLTGSTPTTQPYTTPGADFYAWSMDLFNFFTTITNHHDDFLPNHVQSVLGMPAPKPVANDASFVASPNGASPTAVGENAVGIEGLININSSPWKVIAALPMLPTQPQAANDALAQAIVRYRDQNGPFLNFYDLYKVPEFRAAQDAITAAGMAEPDDADGDFSPLGQGQLDKVHDFEERFLLLNRISNLITLRSDSFTCYLALQGWKGAGTPAPELVVERRVGLIIDRSSLTSSNKTPRVINFPMD